MQLTLPTAPSPAPHVPSVHLLYGDCLEVMPTLPQGCARMVFADLPYGTKHRKTTDCSWDKQVNLDIFFSVAWDVAGNNVLIATAAQPFASFVVMNQIEKFRYDVIWDKCQPQGHFNANRAPLRQHEHVLVFSKKKPQYNPQFTSGASYTRPQGGCVAAFRRRQAKTVRIKTTNDGQRYPISIYKAGRGPDRGLHPTQKPVALLEWLIRTYTNEGDTVLDPVFGSCTTGVACLRTGRNFIGIEKDPTYFEVGRQRVAAEQARLGFPVTV